MPAPSLRALTQLFHPARFSEQDHLVRAGEPARQVAFVQEGVVRAYFTTPEGKEYNKTFFTAPEFAGAYAALVTQTESRISVQCLTACRLLLAPWAGIVSLYAQHRSIETLARLLAEQYFVVKEQREIELVTHNARQRYQRFQAEYPGLEQVIPQYHIASYLGITPTQLSRIRKTKLFT
jgi:CRP-like cAMP-binding protein